MTRKPFHVSIGGILNSIGKDFQESQTKHAKTACKNQFLGVIRAIPGTSIPELFTNIEDAIKKNAKAMKLETHNLIVGALDHVETERKRHSNGKAADSLVGAGMPASNGAGQQAVGA